MIRAITTFGYVGRLRPAPGTWASALAVLLAWPIHAAGGFPLLVIATVLAIGIGLWAAPQEVARQGDKDPAEIVIDEVAGMWLALWPLSAGLWFAGTDPWVFPWPGWVGAFLLFRWFDIRKPGLIGRIDARRDDWGLMADDLVAGACAGAVVLVLGVLFHAAVIL